MNFLDEQGLARLWTHIVAKLGSKVDKVEGKDLSTNDYTNEDKEQLANVVENLNTIGSLIGDKSVSEQINDAAVNNQSDWDMNDDVNPAYIKNRPCYTQQGVIVSYVPEQTVTIDEDGGYVSLRSDIAEHFEEGCTYFVTFNGVEYECVGWHGEGAYYIGNGNIYGGAGMGEDVPFSCDSYGRGEVYLNAQDAGDYTISISVEGEYVHKLDKKYLPDIIGIYGQGEYAEIFNDYRLNVATGNYSHAEGSATTASGAYSHAEGVHTTASGDYSHAEGAYAVSSGEYSHAEGNSAYAIGNFSHAEGASTKASSDYQHVQGKYNIEDSSNIYAHIVGNGTAATARSNAHTIDWNGNAWFAGDIRVGGTSYDNAVSLLPKMTNITLSAANWAGDANPWSQVVTVNGTTAHSKIDLQPTAMQIVDMQNNDIAFMAENNDGVVTVYAIGSKPTADYTMQALITEVAIV